MEYVKYMKLMAKMNQRTNVPQPPVPQFEKYCKLFIDDDEYDVLMGMKLKFNSEEELRALYHGSDWDKCLYGMCRKGLLEKHYPKDAPAYYDLAPMLPGWFEFPLSNGEDNPTVQKATEYFTSAIGMVTTMNVEPMRSGYAFMNNLNKLKGDPGHIDVALPLEGKAATKKVVTVNKELSSDTSSIYPSYQLKAFLESLSDDEPISLMHCFCRNVRAHEGLPEKVTEPQEVCLCVGDMAHQIIEFGVGRAVTKEDAIKILVDSEKKGCIHQVFHYSCDMGCPTTAICNCDIHCCEMLGSYTRGGMQPLYLRSHAKPVIVHPENCTGCNICNRFCPTVATGFNAQTGKVFVEYQRCIGCGVCVTKCPQDVRKMVDEERVLFCKPLPKNLVREPNLKRQTKKK
jgi:Pyruvate/2-oxoacid:ferredoxin oxidoreductase delta subunit